MQKLFLFIILITLLFSCVHAPQDRYAFSLREVYKYAEDNANELKAVLEYYSKNDADTLKYEAALYLIRNMPYHKSFPDIFYSKYCAEMDSLFIHQHNEDTLIVQMEAISEKFIHKLNPILDITNITSKYLIDNIDYAFDKWQTVDYLKHLTFDEFCEYVLPYKCVELQPISNWKHEYNGVFRGEIDLIKLISEYRYNPRMAAEAVQVDLRNTINMKRVRVNYIDILDIKTMIDLPFGDCYERSVLGLLNSRSKDIPVSLDFTPSWADRGANHHWNSVLSNRRLNVDFEPFRFRPGDFHYVDNPYSKVYRYSYKPHQILLEAYMEDNYIPESLSQLFMKDVTNEYSKTGNVSLKIRTNQYPAKYAYLCVFNDYEWVPVDVSKIKNHKVHYEKVGVGLMYIIVIYDNDKQKVVSEPFILKQDGKIKFMQVNKQTLQNIRIFRKYPSFGHIYSVKKYLRQGRIEASNNRDFENRKVMVEFPEWDLLSGEYDISDTTSFRYWRLVSSHNSSSDFGELFFYERTTGKRMHGDLVTPNMPIRNHVYDIPEKICDGDPLTYFAVVGDNRWVGFDFGKPISIGAVAYIRRGDGNDICPDETYELYYWDANCWHLHDTQIADRIYLDFENIPSNALYYIKSPTTGTQNRIFIIENDEIVWY